MHITAATFPEETAMGLEQLEQLFNTDQVLAYIGEMLREAKTAPLAKRFSPERPVGTFTSRSQESVHPSLRGRTEQSYKRGQLAIDITSLRSDFLTLFAQAQMIFLDLQMAQRD